MDETPAPAFSPRTVRKARHILDNYAIVAANDPSVLEIWAYTDRFSYRPGETVGLRISTSADTWDIEIGRDGADYEPVLNESGLPGGWHETPADCSIKGCGWPVAYEFTVPRDWSPGVYLITLTGRRGGETVEEHHLIIVRRAADATPKPIVLVCATGTWVSYNCWGGSNAYDGIWGPGADTYSPILSTRRPWTRGFCKLPAGAPRAVPETPSRKGEMVRYPHMEWAYAYGYSKKYASAGWASYERHFARWAEAAGYDFEIVALHDLHDDASLLDGHDCAVFVGHDEYWSAAMRDAVDAWVENGGRVARFAGNFLWQIRLEDAGATQVCYKYNATDADPLMGTADQALLSGAWEIPEIDRPGAMTFGVNALRGVYAGFGKCEENAGGFTIYRPGHWAFAGTGLAAGEVLGAASRIYGYEVDELDHVIENGLPRALGTDGASPDLVILGVGPATNFERDDGVWGETAFIGSDDGVWKARALYGEATPETVERARTGNGMIVHWPRGKGEIFTAATCEWVMGLTRGDGKIERITRNVLDRFADATKVGIE